MPTDLSTPPAEQDQHIDPLYRASGRAARLDLSGLAPEEYCCESCGDSKPVSQMVRYTLLTLHPKCIECDQRLRDEDRFSGNAERGFGC